MSVLLLVRHAAHDNVGRFLAGRSAGVHLGTDGLAQAARLAARLAGEGATGEGLAVQCSPRERTRETAAAIAEAAGLSAPEAVDALDEIDFGAWSGHDFETLNRDPAFRRWNGERATARTPAGESMGDVQARIVGHMDRLVAEGFAGRQVLVTHADVIKAAVCHVLALPLDAWWRFDIAPASITRLEVGPDGYRLMGLNDVVW